MNQFEMKQRAYQSPLKSRALQILLYLIDRSDKEHTCFPAVPTIARQLHISVSTEKRAMRELVEEGYVKKESRFREGNRGQTSNLYFLFFPEIIVEKENKDSVVKQEEAGEPSEEENNHREVELLNTEEKDFLLDNSQKQILSMIKRWLSIAKWRKNEEIIGIGKEFNRINFFCVYCDFFLWPGEGVNLRPP